MNILKILGSPAILIAAFFSAFIVSYYTAYLINDRYEFVSYKPKNLNRNKVVWSAIAFIVTFVVFILINSLF